MLKLINGRGLAGKRLIRPDTMQLQLSEKDSTASFTCGSEAGSLQTGEWLQDLEDPGKDIVWRIRTIDDQRDTGVRTVGLEHAIGTLKDRVLPGEIKTAEISGNANGASARDAINKILSYQDDWRLGTFDYAGVVKPYHFNGENLRAALDAVSGSLEDPVWTYDFSSYPFRINITRLSDKADSEMRAGRNLRTLRITEDRSQMFTRFYATGKNNIKLPGGYAEKNTAKYGRIDKAETDQSKENAAELQAWAEERLNRHARPGHTVTISGLELSESTGESLDRIRIGYQCRVPLPEDGEVIQEKVTKLQWRDKVKDKTDISVTLADALDDIASIVKEEKQKSGGAGKAAAKASEDMIIEIGETARGLYSAIAQTATNIVLHVHNVLEGYSTIEQTADAIALSVSTAKSDMWSTIIQTATNIYMNVKDAVIEITDGRIELAVGQAKTDMYSSLVRVTSTNIYLSVMNAKSDLSSEINVQAGRIDLVVSGSGSNATIRKAQLILAINGDGSTSAKLKADVIDIDGIVTALAARSIGVGSLHVEGTSEFLRKASFEAGLSSDEEIDALGGIYVTDHSAVWKSFSYDSLSYGTYHYYLYATNSATTVASGSVGAYPVTGHTSKTIYYLGHD